MDSLTIAERENFIDLLFHKEFDIYSYTESNSEPDEDIEEEDVEDERTILMKKSIKELRSMIKEQGITVPIKIKKEELIDDYLNGERCDPEQGEMCSVNKICDIRPLPGNKGICISDERAPLSLQTFVYNGRKIIGSKEAIATLREKLEPKPKSRQPQQPQPAKISDEDIEEVLREMKEPSDDTDNLDEVKNSVFKCLGLISE
jgi:hypothetical protein